jgi:hypothetical protein
MMRAPGDRPVFPPRVVVAVKALACELPKQRGVPLSRYSTRDLAKLVTEDGITASISGTTVWRWLTGDALRPWTFRSWIFPRDPAFAARADRVLDLYHGEWEGRPLGRDDYVLSADEKPGIQARARAHATTPPGPAAPMRVEHEYGRAGALVYLAAWDVHRAKLFGRCEPTSGITPFDALVAQVMDQAPYGSARRVFWVVDNGSSHRGPASADRLARRWPNLILVHLPVHASWLNQIEIFFSILQRKVLRPNTFDSLLELEDSILGFQERYQRDAKPFDWKYTRHDLARLLARLSSQPAPLKIPA